MAAVTGPISADSADVVATDRRCRLCDAQLRKTFVDLGPSPLAQSFLESHQLDSMEPFYPLHVWVCSSCLLVQLGRYVAPEAIFSDYAYFSSFSRTWLDHARAFAGAIVDRLRLSSSSRVVEVASNDGYLLQFFAARGVVVLGVEPAANVARAAEERGIPTRVAFFGRALAEQLAAEGERADLLVGNNVLAHVPDLHDFLDGMALLLAPEGVISLEFPHLIRLVDGCEFDTIYHEHFSYFSFLTARAALARHQLEVFDVEELPTHGGSLRVYAQHSGPGAQPVMSSVAELAERERAAGFDGIEAYEQFAPRVHHIKNALLALLISLKAEGKTIVGYGAPAKGNTLLNFCGIRTDFLDYTVDLSPHKHGRFLPGTRIPIDPPDRIRETRPDYVLILPWNLEAEIVEQLSYVGEWGGRFIVPIPEPRVV